MSIHQAVVRSEQPDQGVRYYVIGLDDWEYFDSLAAYIKQHFGATVVYKQDGLSHRRWTLKIANETFCLEHFEGLGNWFYSDQDHGDSALMQTLAKDLNKRLSHLPIEDGGESGNSK